MKTKIALLIGAAVITLSFTFISKNNTIKAQANTSENRTNEPVGGFVSEGKL